MRAGTKAQAREVMRILAETYPDAACELDHRNPFELLVATVLSAQCTDVRVNAITPALFAEYGDAKALAKAPLDQISEMVRPLGFASRRAAHLTGLSQQLVAQHGGQVPTDRAALEALPGVGRKTASVVLGNAWQLPALPVDTHVGRVARRLGLTRATDPLAVEADLTRLLPPEEWTIASHRLIFLGRRVCHARAPRCGACSLRQLCPRRGVEIASTPTRKADNRP